MKVKTKKCIHCGETSVVDITPEQFKLYQEGIKLVQDIFPEMSADERELVITGTHPKCWDEMFPPEED